MHSALTQSQTDKLRPVPVTMYKYEITPGTEGWGGRRGKRR